MPDHSNDQVPAFAIAVNDQLNALFEGADLNTLTMTCYYVAESLDTDLAQILPNFELLMHLRAPDEADDVTAFVDAVIEKWHAVSLLAGAINHAVCKPLRDELEPLEGGQHASLRDRMSTDLSVKVASLLSELKDIIDQAQKAASAYVATKKENDK